MTFPTIDDATLIDVIREQNTARPSARVWPRPQKSPHSELTFAIRRVNSHVRRGSGRAFAALERKRRPPHLKSRRPQGCATPSGPAIAADQPHVAQPKGGYAMRTFDLAPLYRSTVGFDRLFSMLDNVAGFEGGTPGYPPYNIERTGENAYRISVAVAGFSEAELSIEAKENTLTIRGEKQVKTEDGKSQVLY